MVTAVVKNSFVEEGHVNRDLMMQRSEPCSHLGKNRSDKGSGTAKALSLEAACWR